MRKILNIKMQDLSIHELIAYLAVLVGYQFMIHEI